MRFVLISKFCELSGYSLKAVEKKIYDEVWLEGRMFRKSPDGRIHIDLIEYEKWILR